MTGRTGVIRHNSHISEGDFHGRFIDGGCSPSRRKAWIDNGHNVVVAAYFFIKFAQTKKTKHRGFRREHPSLTCVKKRWSLNQGFNPVGFGVQRSPLRRIRNSRRQVRADRPPFVPTCQGGR